MHRYRERVNNVAHLCPWAVTVALVEAARTGSGGSARDRIVAAAARLLDAGGREAVSIRAVSAAAGVQAPTLYRLFEDKQGLLDALAAHGYSTYLNSKADLHPSADPVQDLRAGWQLNIDFGLANPALYALIYGEPRPGNPSPGSAAAAEVLAAHIHRIAQAGRLRVPEARAAHLVRAAGCGTVLTLIAMPAQERDLGVADLAREAVIAAITTDATRSATDGPVSSAIALRASLPQTTTLTLHERLLLSDWLDRLTDQPSVAPADSHLAQQGSGGA